MSTNRPFLYSFYISIFSILFLLVFAFTANVHVAALNIQPPSPFGTGTSAPSATATPSPTPTIVSTPPAKPTGIHIIDHNGKDLGCGGYTNNRLITVDWNDNTEPDFDHYDYRIREGNIIAHPTISEYTGHIRDIDGVYKYSVRAVNKAGQVSEWSDWCEVTLDRVAPAKPTGLRRLLASDHSQVFECGAHTQIVKLHPDWNDNTEPDFDHYEYTSFNAPDGRIGIHRRIFYHSIFEYNGGWMPTEGTYGFAVRAVDKAGNKSEWALNSETLEGSCQITYDNTPPTTDVYIVGNLDETKNIPGNGGWHGNGWYDNFAQVRLRVTSGDTATDTIKYTLRHGDVSCPAGPYTNEATHNENIAAVVNAMGNGVHTLCYYGTDLAENDETTIHKVVLKIDNQNPLYMILYRTINKKFVRHGVYYLNTPRISVKIAVADFLSGYTRARYDLYKESLSGTCIASTTLRFYGDDAGTFYKNDNIVPAINRGIRTLTRTGIPDGRYCLRIWTYDDVQNKAWSDINGKQWVHFVVDTTAPALAITGIKYSNGAVVNKFITNDNTPTLVGTVSDPNGVEFVKIKVNGHVYRAHIMGNKWTVKITRPLPDKTYTLKIRSKDKLGNKVRITQKLVIDTHVPNATYTYYKDSNPVEGFSTYFVGGAKYTSPVVYVKSPAQLSFTAHYVDPTPSSKLYWDSYVIFEAQDNGSFRFSANGKRAFCSWRRTPNLVDLTSYNSSSINLTTPQSFANCANSLPDGEYYLAHQLYDNATRKDIPSINQFRDILGLHFIVDNTAPTCTIDTFSLANGGTLALNDLSGKNDLSGTATDNLAGIDYVYLTITYKPFDSDTTQWWNGTDWQATSTTVTASWDGTNWNYSIPETAFLEGTYSISATAVDKASNHSVAYRNTIHYDVTAPEVHSAVNPVNSDGDNDWYITQPLISLSATDNFSVDKIEYQWDNDTPGLWLIFTNPLDMLAQGIHTLYYRATDEAGNVSTTQHVTLKWDNVEPTTVSGSITDTNLPTATLIWTPAIDVTSGLQSYTILWHEVTTGATVYSDTVDSSTTTYLLNNLTAAPWSITIRATDNAGNYSEYNFEETFTPSPTPTPTPTVAPSPTPTVAPTAPVNPANNPPATGNLNPAATGRVADQANNANDTTTPTEEQTGAVLGANDINNNQEDNNATTGEVKGVTDTKCTSKTSLFVPLVFLLAQFVILIGVKKLAGLSFKSNLVATTVIALISIGAFYLVYNASKWCFANNGQALLTTWYWIIALVLSGLFNLKKD